ncbi:FHA domain-containing protein PS1 [Mercurialis annua]|uniref:FHA domain-containing protein PS1 n=1 Tax=Mercurialis annua TaxID=3986 RepID=UPI00215FD3A4|nr:FHA domain-containing protein PS1 [Mercurialis annua]
MSVDKEEEEAISSETMIPVFTVIKNGVILKNIFVVNNSNSQESEEILIVGRHPDCNIVLLHPSISRFHLQIDSNLSLHKLFVTDLSSVHGTWVSEKKLDPGIRVELNEGDTLRVGSSTRVYRMHWVPLSRAYDTENPFVSPSDLEMIKEEENAALEEENAEKLSQDEDLFAAEGKHVEEEDTLAILGKADDIYQDEDSLCTKDGEFESVDSILEGIASLFPDNNRGLIKEIPSVPEIMDLSIDVGKPEITCSSRNDHELSLKNVGGVILQTLSQLFYECKQSSDYHSATEAALEEEKMKMVISSMARIKLESDIEVCNQSSDSHSATESVLEEGKTDISTERIERQSNIEAGNRSSDCHSATEAIMEDEKTDISCVDVTSSSSPEMDAILAYEILEVEKNHSEVDSLEYINCSLPEIDVLDTNHEQEDKERQVLEPPASVSPLYEEGNQMISTENQTSNMLVSSQSVCAEDTTAAEILVDEEKQKTFIKEYRQSEFKGVCSTGYLKLSLLPGEVSSAIMDSKERQTPQNIRRSCIRSGKKSSSDSRSRRGKHGKESRTPQSTFPAIEDLSLPLGNVFFDIMDTKVSQTPQNIRSSPDRSEKKSSSNIWSRRGKPATPLQLQTSKSRRKNKNVDINADVEWENQENLDSKSITKFPGSEAMNEEIFTPDKENRPPSSFSRNSFKKGLLEDIQSPKSITKVLFPGSEAMDEEIFTPDKENRPPNSRLHKSIKKTGLLEDIQPPTFCKSSPNITFFPSSIGKDEDMITSPDKENRTPKVLKQRNSARPSSHLMKMDKDLVLKERSSEKVPLLSLFSNSPRLSLSEASVPDTCCRSFNSINCMEKKVTNSTSIKYVGDGRRRWTMIADTTSLLDKESRKFLQLLEGLKGTHLVIPRMVIRELDSLKQRGSLFRRTTEAELALKWIEDCMMKEKWWIHVQSSTEDIRAIAPTPPASPVLRFSDGSWGFPFGNLHEIVSPTAEDCILENAVSYRKRINEGQLVLLSNDVTLKIKAMAEGLICETAEEFRESLVNPFSERFMWADSSPRGQTWTVFDDLVLKERYYRRSPSKKLSKGGLKLILLHNSQYGQQCR